MLPYKTWRGREALKRVRAFEGVPPRYQRVKKQVAPHALRVICLGPGRKVCVVRQHNVSEVVKINFLIIVLHCWPHIARGWLEVPGCYHHSRSQTQDQGFDCLWQEEDIEGNLYSH